MPHYTADPAGEKGDFQKTPSEKEARRTLEALQPANAAGMNRNGKQGLRTFVRGLLLSRRQRQNV